MFLEETLVLCFYVPVPVDGSGFWSWIRVSGGKKSGKVLLSVTWGFFFPFGREEKERLVWWTGRNSGSWSWASGNKKSGLLVLFLRMGQVTGSAHEKGSSNGVLEANIWVTGG